MKNAEEIYADILKKTEFKKKQKKPNMILNLPQLQGNGKLYVDSFHVCYATLHFYYSIYVPLTEKWLHFIPKDACDTKYILKKTTHSNAM